MDAPIPLFGGSGVYINGGTVGGLDLMAVFTKEFWNKTNYLQEPGLNLVVPKGRCV